MSHVRHAAPVVCCHRDNASTVLLHALVVRFTADIEVAVQIVADNRIKTVAGNHFQGNRELPPGVADQVMDPAMLSDDSANRVQHCRFVT